MRLQCVEGRARFLGLECLVMVSSLLGRLAPAKSCVILSSPVPLAGAYFCIVVVVVDIVLPVA